MKFTALNIYAKPVILFVLLNSLSIIPHRLNAVEPKDHQYAKAKILKVAVAGHGKFDPKAEVEIEKFFRKMVQEIKNKNLQFPYDDVELIDLPYPSPVYPILQDAISSLTPLAFLIYQNKDSAGLIPLFVTKKRNELLPYYSSIFIANKNSEINSLQSPLIDTIYLVARNSASGYLYPSLELYALGVTKSMNIDSSGLKIIYLNKHRDVVNAVQKSKNAIGATWTFDNWNDPTEADVKVLLRFECIPQDPIVISKNLSPYKDEITAWIKNNFNKEKAFSAKYFEITGVEPYSLEFKNAFDELYRKYELLGNAKRISSKPEQNIAISYELSQVLSFIRVINIVCYLFSALFLILIWRFMRKQFGDAKRDYGLLLFVLYLFIAIIVSLYQITEPEPAKVLLRVISSLQNGVLLASLAFFDKLGHLPFFKKWRQDLNLFIFWMVAGGITIGLLTMVLPNILSQVFKNIDKDESAGWIDAIYSIIAVCSVSLAIAYSFKQREYGTLLTLFVGTFAILITAVQILIVFQSSGVNMIFLSAADALNLVFVALLVLQAQTWVTEKLVKRAEEESMQSKISEGLHDDIGGILTRILSLSFKAKQKIDANENKEVIQILDKIGQDSRKVMDKISDIAWILKPGNNNLQQLIDRMQSFAYDLLRAQDISIDFRQENNLASTRMALEIRENCYLIFQEAVNNAAKYSECTEITVEIKSTDKIVDMVISDNGKGFDTSKKMSGNGLENMKHRAEVLNGSLRIESYEAHGTQIYLTVPLKGD